MSARAYNGAMRPCYPGFGSGPQPHSWNTAGHRVRCSACGMHLADTLLDGQQGPPIEPPSTTLPLAEAQRPTSKPSPTTNRYAWVTIQARGFTRCYWCREPFTEQRPPTEDHVRPVSQGGRRCHGIVFSCQSCNSARGDTDFATYLRAVEYERAVASRERRSYQRPRYRKISGEWVLGTLSRRQLKELRRKVPLNAPHAPLGRAMPVS